MATESNVISVNFDAAADLSGNQYYAVKMSAANSVNVGTTQDSVIGILQNKPKSGEAASVAILGISKAVSGGIIAAADSVGPGVLGKLVKKTLKDTNSGVLGTFDTILGKALVAANTNEVFSVLLLGASDGQTS